MFPKKGRLLKQMQYYKEHKYIHLKTSILQYENISNNTELVVQCRDAVDLIDFVLSCLKIILFITRKVGRKKIRRRAMLLLQGRWHSVANLPNPSSELKKSESLQTEGRHFRSMICKLSDV